MNNLQSGKPIKPKSSRDDRQMLLFMVVIASYLVVALALPLYAILERNGYRYRAERRADGSNEIHIRKI